MTKPYHIELGLTDEKVIDMYRYMLLARKLDERLLLLNRAGKAAFTISGQGQEATQIGAGFALDLTQDYIAPYYRDLGLVLVAGMTPKEVMLHLFGKAADPNSGGRQMPGHYGYKANRIITGSSPVTTQVPHAVGFALAAKYKEKDFVTLATLGDGSTNQGDFHEGLNFAGVHDLPVITLVQNNKIAISVPFEKQIASKNIAIRANSYGMPGIEVDGNDPLKVYEVMKEAHKRAKNGEGPTLIEAVSERLSAHSSDDNHNQYRTEEELKEMRERDCNVSFRKYLVEHDLINDEIEKEMLDEINKEINEATKFAEKSPYADVSTIHDYVYEKK